MSGCDQAAPEAGTGAISDSYHTSDIFLAKLAEDLSKIAPNSKVSLVDRTTLRDGNDEEELLCLPPECEGTSSFQTYEWIFGSVQVPGCEGTFNCDLRYTFDVTRCDIGTIQEFSFSNFSLTVALDCFSDGADVSCILRGLRDRVVDEFMGNNSINIPCDSSILRIESSVYKSTCNAYCGNQLGDVILWKLVACGETCCIQKTKWCDNNPIDLGSVSYGPDCSEDAPTLDCRITGPCSDDCASGE